MLLRFCRFACAAGLSSIFLCSLPAVAQSRPSGFGPAILPESPQEQRDNVPLITTPPPRDLASGAEVVVISGYQPDRGAAKRVHVVVDRPGRKVFVVLAMTEEVIWALEARPGTVVQGVIVVSASRGRLRMSQPVPAYAVRIPFSYTSGNSNFVRMQDALHRQFGITKIDVLRAHHTQAAVVEVNQVDPPRAEYVYTLPRADPPPRVVDFELMAANHAPVRWRLDGPLPTPGGRQATPLAGYLVDRKLAVAPDGATVYTLQDEGISAMDVKSGSRTAHRLPFYWPRLSWGEGIAYDSKRHIVSIVSLGGEGFFYRFNAQKGSWLDQRSMQNVDANSLTYDPKGDRYVAWVDHRVMFISPEGVPEKPFAIRDKLPGLVRVTSVASILVLVPRGDDLVVAALKGGDVKAIWHYAVSTGTGTLTYLNGLEAK